MKLHLDFETYSAASLKECGAHVYAADRSTVVTVIAWAFDNGPVKSVVWPATKHMPPEILVHIINGGTVSAHNAGFEHAILTEHFGMGCPFNQLDCTMERAYVWGLPGKLGQAGRALKLSVVKDEKEKPLMIAMSKPPKKGPPIHEVDPVKLDRLRAYCVQDVEAERALDEVLPPLSRFERKVSLLTSYSNDTGVMIDGLAVGVLQGIVDKELAGLNKEIKALTGLSFGQRDKLLEWLELEGVAMPDLKKETVAEYLEKEIRSPAARRVLEIRALAGKSSLAKLGKMGSCVGLDSRARGQIQYYGAGRTGRWAGRLIQPQNLPRPPKGLDVVQALETIVRMGEVPAIVYDRPLDVISACLRPCIIARPFHTLLSLDFSQIEARVVAWLAGQQDVLDLFAKGEDVYTYAAHGVGSNDRQLGKVLTLACGFGMGKSGERLQHTARTQYGLELTLEEAASAVVRWRDNNKHIVWLWWDLENAALEMLGVPNPGVEEAHRHRTIEAGGVYNVRGIKMKIVTDRHGNRLLGLRKPNGDKLWYHGPHHVGTWDALGRPRRGLAFMGVLGSAWKADTTYGGKLTENLTQAVARDLMAEAIVRIKERLGLVPIMTVHDEAVYEIPIDVAPAVAALIKAVFEEVPAWAAGLPIASDAKSGGRFSK